ncbi:MAG: type II toxin-antitoxin system PemK/MazF family toxin [Ignavibacteria bacterium]|nr:type II toxin-antitoxin system PemK/MazF family toxin [Ignavibacteria bacterium]
MKRSEIWLINLEPTIGAEMKKIRPAVIVNDDAMGVLPLKIVVPITEWNEQFQVFPWMVKIYNDNLNRLEKISSADTFQVRSVSQERFVKRIGSLSQDSMNKISKALSTVLKIY